VDLSAVSTRELHEELAQREGVKEYVFGPENEIELFGDDGVIIRDNGPVRVLVNRD